MKPRWLCVCVSVLVFGLVGAAYGLPQETLLVSEQASTLLVQCGMGIFDPVPVYTMPVAFLEGQQSLPLLTSDEQHAATAVVPEPSTLGLLGMGVLFGLGLVGLRRRITRKQERASLLKSPQNPKIRPL